MSTQPIRPAWKQEVNQRLAAHKNRKGTTTRSAIEKTPGAKPGTSRAAEAAARVAERYSKAPTYSQMQAEEARAAVRAAEIATQVAIAAQAAAQSALQELHAAVELPMRGPAVVESIVRPAPVESPATNNLPDQPESSILEQEAIAEPKQTSVAPLPPPVFTQENIDGKSFNLRWEPDTPARGLQMPAIPARPREQFELAAEDWWTPSQINETLHSEPFRVDAESGHANLIEFPRELIAARKLRPRLADGSGDIDRAQLSIFEVDPGSISFEPMPEPRLQAAYSGPGWSGMELEAQPDRAQSSPAEAPVKRRLHLAPFGLRLMALSVDLSVIIGCFSAAALGLLSKTHHLPAPKPAEALAVIGLLLIAFSYHALFFAWSNMTPGMWYAGIALCTFDSNVPTREQLRRRLGAMAVSLLPVGLGIVWSVFDDDHLSWHDRISGTYLRRR